jgi:hypothetical protein
MLRAKYAGKQWASGLSDAELPSTAIRRCVGRSEITMTATDHVFQASGHPSKSKTCRINCGCLIASRVSRGSVTQDRPPNGSHALALSSSPCRFLPASATLALRRSRDSADALRTCAIAHERALFAAESARMLCHESAREHRLGPTIAFA